MPTPKTDNGMRSDVLSQLEVIKSFLKQQEKNIFQFQVLKFTLPDAQEMVVVEHLP
jgi:hypothetical protein